MASGSLPASQALPLIMRYESNGRNVNNYAYDATHTASGYYQITNSTWSRYAGSAGVDTSIYPTASSAPQDVQTAVATQIYNNEGAQPWAAYNAPLRSALADAGYSGPVGQYVGPLGNQTPTGSATMVGPDGLPLGGGDYTGNGSISGQGMGGSLQQGSPGVGLGIGSAGQAGVAAAGQAWSTITGLPAVVAEVATRTMVVLVGLSLLTIALIWAMRDA